jgi:hypothetical protein
MTSPHIQRDLIAATVSLRGARYTVWGWIEDGAFIAERLEPVGNSIHINLALLSDSEWAEVDYQFWLQHDASEGSVDPDDSPTQR